MTLDMAREAQIAHKEAEASNMDRKLYDWRWKGRKI